MIEYIEGYESTKPMLINCIMINFIARPKLRPVLLSSQRILFYGQYYNSHNNYAIAITCKRSILDS